MGKDFYITTTLPYVNADPHMGFALEIVQADVIARHRRSLGESVFFNTGTDEHGQKVFLKAEEKGIDTQDYVDQSVARFKNLKESLNVSFDNFIRTTDKHHELAAQSLWKKCFEKGDIYKKKYKGKYCVGDEMFIREVDLVDGKCPHHPNIELTEIEEENYFFNLKNYKEKLLEYLGKDEVIIPEWRRKEAIAFVEQVEDFSISREAKRMGWGIPVPDDDSQVMYVWFDALTSYISTLGWPEDKEGDFKKYWVEGESVQVAGKDQVRFQSIMWQAMLISADLPTTDQIFYHGFITHEGAKMSKSLGNVVDPLKIIEEYSIDALRYYLLREIPSYEDGDFTAEHFKEVYNANLANGLGNLVSRIMKMAVNYNVMVDYSQRQVFEEELKVSDSFGISSLLREFKFQGAMDSIWGQISELDKYIADKEPYKKIKTHEEEAKKELGVMLERLLRISVLLKSFMPDTAETMQGLLKDNRVPENPLFVRK